jgi:hypothetical protein
MSETYKRPSLTRSINYRFIVQSVLGRLGVLSEDHKRLGP